MNSYNNGIQTAVFMIYSPGPGKYSPGPGQYSPGPGIGQLGHQLNRPAGRPPAAGQANLARARALAWAIRDDRPLAAWLGTKA